MGKPLFGVASGVYQQNTPGKDKTMTADIPGAQPETDTQDAAPAKRDLPPAAQRALAEAAERRAKADALAMPPEFGGREGPEPVRYGDWESKGLAIDF